MVGNTGVGCSAHRFRKQESPGTLAVRGSFFEQAWLVVITGRRRQPPAAAGGLHHLALARRRFGERETLRADGGQRAQRHGTNFLSADRRWRRYNTRVLGLARGHRATRWSHLRVRFRPSESWRPKTSPGGWWGRGRSAAARRLSACDSGG
jgi:hypothetical protein